MPCDSQRLKRMQRNAAKLQQLAVQQSLADLHQPVKTTQNISKIKSKERNTKKPTARQQPVRSSARVRGVAADGAQILSTMNDADAGEQDHTDAGETSLALSAFASSSTPACCKNFALHVHHRLSRHLVCS